MTFKVRDLGLAPEGRLKIEWAEAHMPVLQKIRERLVKSRPLEGIRISACLHVTKETAVLVRTLIDAGAKVSLAASNPLSTQDDVAAALAEEGVEVYAWKGMNVRDYYETLAYALKSEPSITMDDGGDLTALVHKLHYKESGEDVQIAKNILGEIKLKDVIIGGTEETTTGVLRLKALSAENKLIYPVIAVNESQTKYLFDNRYGTGQSSLDGVIRATNLLVAGKTVVVAGYGWVGKGIAMRARGLGARVVVVETDPIKALEAYYDGFYVTSMDEASTIGDIFITATGNVDVIRGEHMKKMKDCAVLSNAGHFNVEINIQDLEQLAVASRRIRPEVDEYKLPDGRRIYLISAGRLVNLAAAEGHPSEVMDMSFSNQVLAVLYLVKHKGKMPPGVYKLPRKIDYRIAELKLKALNIRIEKLTEKQRKYLQSWRLGT
ncbi:MAG: adenosylhomocysteinase [Thermofilaceae archaeon]|nr:adenosylhomocysteinase [Thermofilaceae archaeon]MCX8181167.1 adenosylhomocysteinase [Thermofilaceae archaeon]MDW8004790.1 adenosylhomocysteinase [Thermofilaceae archaeon]